MGLRKNNARNIQSGRNRSLQSHSELITVFKGSQIRILQFKMTNCWKTTKFFSVKKWIQRVKLFRIRCQYSNSLAICNEHTQTCGKKLPLQLLPV